ncbi:MULTISPECIES: methylamine utilization protein MauD [Roseobacteraceae]|uniref:Methylamine utilization protein MauD n=1 Tax=Celeribacter baekdonensis B30 TaxID=1208323 RepID=K2JGV5_9RHOB|nr:MULTISPECIES: methylamine utilization protein MauD [Roseobacteraceae]EKE74403.1 methylamine utilization protein MauD [Celeribacter baekdonensis B30]KAB6716481.1 thiol-disulfide isomerase [Roseobacter sp. TSBP12]|tara:strand:+ start:6028 stop:6633 length:606 start_codon:yes stop_codon:yes gene_type:complete
MTALVFLNVAMFVMILGLAFGLLAMGRQIGILFERVAPMGALVNDAGPQVGMASPQFTLESRTGGMVTIGPRADRSTLVFFLSPTCPVCKKLLPIVNHIRKAEGAWLEVVLASDGGDLAQHDRFITSAKLQDYPYVVSTELGLGYRVARLPYAVLLDQHGVIRAKGLINSREQFDSLFNALDLKTPSIQSYLSTQDVQPAH